MNTGILPLDELTALVKAAQANDDSAKERLYLASVRFAYAAITRILKKDSDIEDALQNTFLKTPF